jgi:hypothetical protein
MTPAEPVRVVATWFGVFRVAHGRVERAYPFPHGREALAERTALRREGRLVPEELRLLAEAEGQPLVARDRRFAASGVAIAPGPEPRIDPLEHGFALRELRDLELVRAEEDLGREWDPTVHVQEAVHALAELEELSNTLGERLSSWASRDRSPLEEDEAGHRRLAREIIDATAAAPSAGTAIDPSLRAARQSLATLYLEIDRTRTALEGSLTESVPREAPNLCDLLGPLLTARLLQKAGSLERLARNGPSSSTCAAAPPRRGTGSSSCTPACTRRRGRAAAGSPGRSRARSPSRRGSIERAGRSSRSSGRPSRRGPARSRASLSPAPGRRNGDGGAQALHLTEQPITGRSAGEIGRPAIAASSASRR